MNKPHNREGAALFIVSVLTFTLHAKETVRPRSYQWQHKNNVSRDYDCTTYKNLEVHMIYKTIYFTKNNNEIRI